MGLMPGAGFYLVSAPTAEPISLDEAKIHARIDITDDDALVSALITAARLYCEGVQNRAYVTQTWDLTMDRFPGRELTGGYSGNAYGLGTHRRVYDGRSYPDAIEFPSAPLRSVGSLTYTDSTGAATVWDPANYIVDTKHTPGRLALGYQRYWPTVTLQPINGVAVRFVAGSACPFTVNTTTNVVTAPGHALIAADPVRLSNSGGALPGGLAVDTDYYPVNILGSTLQLAATAGGTAIDITSAGTGVHFLGLVPKTAIQAMYLLIGHWYENREAVVTGTISKEIEFAVNALLWLDRVVM